MNLVNNALWRRLGSLGLMVAQLCWSPALRAQDPAPSAEDLRETVAEANVVAGDADTVRAGKNAGKVFEAAHALLKSGDRKQASKYFERGLQLSPWRLEEQLAYADVLMALDRKKEAMAIATMVDERSESDKLCNEARKLAGTEPVPTPPGPDEKLTRGPWICLVPLGHINHVVLADTMHKLHETLGIPVFLYGETVELGKPQRSAFGRWVKTKVMTRMKWDTQAGRQFLAAMGAASPDDIKPSKFVEALVAGLRSGGRGDEAKVLEDNATFYRKHDQQWDAVLLADYGFQATAGMPHRDQAVVFGITEADLYGDNTNYLFGLALTGARKGVVSYARYRADFEGEPPDRARLVTRMHKGLLSSVGFALNVPRPTDPTSARAYPASLAEHDAKSEYMSEACVDGFERALGVKLPEAAHKPTGRR